MATSTSKKSNGTTTEVESKSDEKEKSKVSWIYPTMGIFAGLFGLVILGFITFGIGRWILSSASPAEVTEPAPVAEKETEATPAAPVPTTTPAPGEL